MRFIHYRMKNGDYYGRCTGHNPFPLLTPLNLADDKQRRIVIPQELWDLERLQKNDYIEINVKKVERIERKGNIK